jgi:TldD protein
MVDVMTSTTKLVEQNLLAPADLTESKLQTVLGKMFGGKIDSAELYLQNRHTESWYLEDGIVRDASYNIERGVGARAISGEKTGFAYSDDIVMPALENAAKAARSISYHQGEGKIKVVDRVNALQLYSADNPLVSLREIEKIALLQRINTEARALDPRVVQVNATLSGAYDIIHVMDSEGHMASDVRPLVRLNVTVIVEEDGRREQGYAGGGGRSDYQQFIAADKAMEYVREAVRTALVNLEAKSAPAGEMPIVMGPGWSGVLLHEAVGHGLEGDFNRKGVSAFSGRIGEKVASEHCTVVDNGAMMGRRGSLSIDDEGTATGETVLIEKGILRGYMQDKLNAKLTGTKSTGNGRRESYAHLTIPRMTNTYMEAGQHEPDEIIASVDKGLYIRGLGGGSVDITSGKFVFSTSEAYLIEDGKIKHPVKGATLIGNGPDIMQKVSMVGNDLELDTGIGICGKDGQSVPVGVGQPTIRIDAITVGGTEA